MKIPRAILHDENRYADSERFNPARFLTAAGKLDPDVPDPIEAFGHGRRVCPGRNFAIDALWLAVSNILTAFVIEKPVDECGNIIEPSGEYSSGVFRLDVLSSSNSFSLLINILVTLNRSKPRLSLDLLNVQS